MKVLLEIDDKKAPALLRVLKDLKYVKAKKLKQSRKEEIIDGLKQAVEEVNLAKEGRVTLKTAQQLLNEL